MCRVTPATLVLLLGLLLTVPSCGRTGNQAELVLEAIIAVESGGRARAVGPDGESVGILMIRRELVDDLNRIARLQKTGLRFTYDDRLDPGKSKQMFRLYVRFYGGERPTPERTARIWNGGPKGPQLDSTLGYWQKVRREMERIQRGLSGTRTGSGGS